MLCMLNSAEDISEDLITERRTWMKHNSVPINAVREAMMVTRPHRLSWIHGEEQPTISAIVQEYPRLKDGNGHLWVSCVVLYKDVHYYRTLYLS